MEREKKDFVKKSGENKNNSHRPVRKNVKKEIKKDQTKEVKIQ